MTGFQDGDGAKTGKGYLDIADFIMRGGCKPEKDLEQLYRRVAFNMCVGNTDDHFRNHGFLLTEKGWQLSPAYDLNPTVKTYHALMTTPSTNESDLTALLAAEEDYMIDTQTAKRIIDEVKSAVSDWKTLAQKLGIAKGEMKMFEGRFFE